MPRILVTNDDGYRSEGIHALAEALRAIGDVTVVAPVEEASAIGHALTLRRPLRLETIADRETGIFFDDVTPASMAAALDAVAAAQFEPERLRANAERFSRERHVEQMHAVIEETLRAPIGTMW